MGERQSSWGAELPESQDTFQKPTSDINQMLSDVIICMLMYKYIYKYNIFKYMHIIFLNFLK